MMSVTDITTNSSTATAGNRAGVSLPILRNNKLSFNAVIRQLWINREDEMGIVALCHVIEQCADEKKVFECIETFSLEIMHMTIHFGGGGQSIDPKKGASSLHFFKSSIFNSQHAVSPTGHVLLFPCIHPHIPASSL